MIEGASIRLRTWQDGDIPTLLAIRNDVSLQAQLLSRARGSSEQDVIDWLKRHNKSTDSILLVIANKANNEPLGFIQAEDFNTIDRNTSFGICLIDKARGQGRCTEAINLMSDYLRNIWGARKIMISVRSDNESARRCYRKSGFNECGLLQSHTFIDGNWQDVILLERHLIDTEK